MTIDGLGGEELSAQNPCDPRESSTAGEAFVAEAAISEAVTAATTAITASEAATAATEAATKATVITATVATHCKDIRDPHVTPLR